MTRSNAVAVILLYLLLMVIAMQAQGESLVESAGVARCPATQIVSVHMALAETGAEIPRTRDVSAVGYETDWLKVDAYITRYDEVTASWVYPGSPDTIRYCVGTLPCIDDVYEWTATASPHVNQVTVDDLDLEDETTYYFSIMGMKAGQKDSLASCPFRVDLRSDILSLQVSPSDILEAGQQVTVTATLTDCRGKAIQGRNILFEVDGEYFDASHTTSTDHSGTARYVFTRPDAGWANIMATEYQPTCGNVEEVISVKFIKPLLVEVVVVREGAPQNSGLCDERIYEMITWLDETCGSRSIPTHIGALAVNERRCIHRCETTGNYMQLVAWLNMLPLANCWFCDASATAPDRHILAEASSMFTPQATHRYITVLSSRYETWNFASFSSAWYSADGNYAAPDIIQMLQAPGCRSFIDKYHQAWYQCVYPEDSISDDDEEYLDGECDPLYLHEW